MITSNTCAGGETRSTPVVLTDRSHREATWGSEILVVDDDAAVRKSLLRLLACRGYSTIAAQNGTEALHLAVERKPPVILMDLQMPIMNGFEAACAIKAHAVLSDVQIIAFSASPTRRDQSSLVFVHTLQKPCPAATVMAAVEAAISQHCLRNTSSSPFDR